MLTYNTQRKKLPLPEYGRNIQKMVDYCCSLQDREERNRCARTIIKTMSILFPKRKDSTGILTEENYWDLLAIMCNFSMDIDWPESTVKQEELMTKPAEVPMTQGPMRFHVYGKNVQRLMEYAIDLPGGDEKDELIMLLANQMKKQLASLYPEGVEDTRIFKDIATMTGGKIILNTDNHKLYEYKVIQPSSKKKKKK